jgi:hypothetical protein
MRRLSAFDRTIFNYQLLATAFRACESLSVILDRSLLERHRRTSGGFYHRYHASHVPVGGGRPGFGMGEVLRPHESSWELKFLIRGYHIGGGGLLALSSEVVW